MSIVNARGADHYRKLSARVLREIRNKEQTSSGMWKINRKDSEECQAEIKYNEIQSVHTFKLTVVTKHLLIAITSEYVRIPTADTETHPLRNYCVLGLSIVRYSKN
jgi:hypothetical protein